MATITGTFNSLVSGTLSGVIGTPGPRGLPGATGATGATGPAGSPGVGVPAGGSTGQYLVKTSGLDFATGWQTLSLSGYLSLAGGEMNANAEITFEDTALGRVALASGSAFAVSSSSNPDLVSNVLFDRVFSKNATSQTTLKPTGIEFPDLTLQTSAGITAATAASTYQTLAGMSSYLTTSAAASTYAVIARGLPTGGTVGQVLTKNSGTNFDASFATLIPGDRYLTTSTTSNAVSNGNKTFTIGTGLSYTPTQNITISYDATNHMHGEVLTYNSGTGVLTVDINNHTGTGTYASWVVNVGGVTPATSVAWGDITGTLGSQSDLATALNNKLEVSTAASTYYLQTNPDGFIGDAPSDGSQYARQNGAWEVVSGGGGGIPDAPSDNKLYGRINGVWFPVQTFSQLGTNITSISGWVFGGSPGIFLDASNTLLVQSPANMSSFNASLSGTSPVGAISFSSAYVNLTNVAFDSASSMFSFQNINTLPNLTTISYYNCAGTGTFTFGIATTISILYCPDITILPPFSPTTATIVNVNGCSSLTSADFSGTSSLTTPTITGNSSLTSINLTGCSAISSVTINGNSSLTSVTMPPSSSLNYFEMSGCPGMTALPSYVGGSNVSTVNIQSNGFTGGPDLQSSPNLTTVYLAGNTSMQGGGNFNNCISLTSLNLSGLPIVYPPSVSNTPMTYLDVSGCAIYDSMSFPPSYLMALMGQLDANGYGGGFLNMSGGTNAAYDYTSDYSYQNLISKGWTIIYNP